MLFAYENHFASLFKNKPKKTNKGTESQSHSRLKRRGNKWEVECLFNDRSTLSVQMRSRLIRNSRGGGGVEMYACSFFFFFFFFNFFIQITTLLLRSSLASRKYVSISFVSLAKFHSDP